MSPKHRKTPNLLARYEEESRAWSDLAEITGRKLNGHVKHGRMNSEANGGDAYSGAMTRRTAVLVLSGIPVARYATALQQNRISPHETVSINVNGNEISITYGRPHLKQREFGTDVAPFGQVWRLGADEATKLTLTSSVKVQGGPHLVAGSYSLWAIPGKEKWTLIVNKAANVWGTDYDQSQDVAHFDLPVHKTAPLEEFTIALTKKPDNSAEVSFAWGTHTATAILTLA
jgi:hypothetical protein